MPPTLRLIEHTKNLYYADDLSAPLPEGVLESKGIPYENYQLAYTENNTSDLLDDIFNGKATGADMLLGQFENIDDDWWIRSGVIDYIDKSLSTPETAADAAARFYTPIAYTDQYGSTTTVSYDPNYFLFVEETEDALQNTHTVTAFDYRTLSPVEMKDQNDNLSAVILDELGLPKAMALMGKGSQADELTNLTPQTLNTEQTDIADFFDEADNNITDSDNLHDIGNTLLREATARFVYDLHSYANNGTPCVVSSILREEHYAINDASPLQISFEYSNGMGKVAMKKVQAEAGEAKQVTDNGNGTITVTTVSDTSPNLRWIGTGRTVLNNKGNAVKQYEPFFSVTAKYESQTELTENGVTPILYYDAQNRLIKTEFPDGTFSKTEYSAWKQTDYDQNDTCDNTSAWYVVMNGGSAEEQNAATKSYAHFDTPKISHFDTLGRVTTEEENDGTNILYTHLVLDIEGNLRQVIDARGNSVMQYKYDMLGHNVYQESADSGVKLTLLNAVGLALYTWDADDREIETVYDILKRPVQKLLKIDSTTTTLENYVYGEGQTNDKTNNLRGQLYQHFDGSGKKQINSYDFKNNPLTTQQQLLDDTTLTDTDWDTSPTLSSETFITTTTYDALNRQVSQTDAGSNTHEFFYDKGGLLKSVKLNSDDYVNDIHYNSKNQREVIWYNNDTKTSYEYDEKTFRLKRLLTVNLSNSDILQDLNYWYDAVGNITTIEDDAQQTLYFNNSVVSPTQQFAYDALYRLIEATGRELIGTATFGTDDNYNDSAWQTTHKGNGNAVQNYTQQYEYDEVGNILSLQHIANAGSYTRLFDYDNVGNNQLTKTTVGTDEYDYTYDTRGNITDMPHLQSMSWNALNELYEITQGTVTTNYQYSQNQRIRKYTDKGSIKEERIYLGNFEIYRKYVSGTLSIERTTVHVSDDTGRIAMLETRTQGTDPSPAQLKRFIYSNHIQSASLELDENADIISYEEFHAFGTTSYQAVNATINAVAKRYRYVSKERDDESGLYYYGARYYATWLCRFISCDPKVNEYLPQSCYVHADNNPVKKIDFNGEGTGDGDDKKKDDNASEKAKKTNNTQEHVDIVKQNLNENNKKFAVGDKTKVVVKNKSANVKEEKGFLDNVADVLREIDNYIEKQQNKPDDSKPVKAEWISGQMPIGEGSTKNNYIQGNRFTEITKNDGVYGWLPGGLLGGVSQSKMGTLLETGQKGVYVFKSAKGKDLVEGINTNVSGGNDVGENVEKLFPNKNQQSETNTQSKNDTTYKVVKTKNGSTYNMMIISKNGGAIKDTFHFVPSSMIKRKSQ